MKSGRIWMRKKAQIFFDGQNLDAFINEGIIRIKNIQFYYKHRRK